MMPHEPIPDAAPNGSVSESESEKPLADMAPLIARLRQTLHDWPSHVGSFLDESLESFRARTGFAARRERRADVVLASQTAVELGHPRTKSCAFVLATWESGQVRDGQVTRVGPDFDSLSKGAHHPFAQVVIRDRLNEQGRRQYAEAAVAMLDAALPEFPYGSWDSEVAAAHDRLDPHALAAAGHADR